MITYPEASQKLFAHLPPEPPQLTRAKDIACRALSHPLLVTFDYRGIDQDLRIGVVTLENAKLRMTLDEAPEIVISFLQNGRIMLTLCLLDKQKLATYIRVINILYSLQSNTMVTIEEFLNLYETTRQAQLPSPKKQSPKKQSPKKQSPNKQSPNKQSPNKQSPNKQSPNKKSPKKSPTKKSAQDETLQSKSIFGRIKSNVQNIARKFSRKKANT